jgi:hypothetical protein
VGSEDGASVGSEVGSPVGSEVGSPVGSEVGVATGSEVGSRVGFVIGPYISRNLLMKFQKLSHQLFQSKIEDSEVVSAESFTFRFSGISVVGIGVDSGSTQFPFTTLSSLQFSACAETGKPTIEIIARKIPPMNTYFGLNISVSY